MAKLFALETALKTADMSQQVHGAYGIDRDYEVERVQRDSRFLVYGGGTPEVLKMTIARELNS